MKADDLRELRRATKAVKRIKRDIAEIFGPSPLRVGVPPPPLGYNYPPPQPQCERYSPAHPRHPELQEFGVPQHYSYVLCESCDAPALLVRDNSNQTFAACCLNCCTITHLESIIEEKL